VEDIAICTLRIKALEDIPSRDEEQTEKFVCHFVTSLLESLSVYFVFVFLGFREKRKGSRVFLWRSGCFVK